MEHLKIIFEHSEEVHGYEHRITKDINNKKDYYCLDKRENEIYGFYLMKKEHKGE